MASSPWWIPAVVRILLIEAAFAALQQPLASASLHSEGWADFQPELWQQEMDRAQQRRRRNRTAANTGLRARPLDRQPGP